MKIRLFLTTVMAAIPALSIFAANNLPDSADIALSILIEFAVFVFWFFLIKYFFDKNNPDIESKWLIAHPLFICYAWIWAFYIVIKCASEGFFVSYAKYYGEVFFLVCISLIVGLVVFIIAIFTIYRILKHKTKPFNNFPAIMRYCSIAFTISFIGFSYHFYEIEKFSSHFGVSYGGEICCLLLLVAIVWGLQYKFNESAEWIIHDGTSSANDKNARTGISTSNSNTKQCPYCGETILAVAKKCRYCGEWIKEDTPKLQLPCPICGELVDEGTELCPHCKESITLPSVDETNNSQQTIDPDNSGNVYEEDNYRTFYIITAIISIGIPIIIFIIVLLVGAMESGNSTSVSSGANTTEYADTVYGYDEYPDTIGSDYYEY